VKLIYIATYVSNSNKCHEFKYQFRNHYKYRLVPDDNNYFEVLNIPTDNKWTQMAGRRWYWKTTTLIHRHNRNTNTKVA